jgi:DNA-binding response OmpR family regulator
MSEPPCILIYGSDAVLIQSRGLVLEKAGFSVRTALELNDAELIISTRQVQLCILCRSLSSKECLTLLATAQNLHPKLKILSLHTDTTICYMGMDVEVLGAFLSPLSLIEAVCRTLDRPVDDSILRMKSADSKSTFSGASIGEMIR